MKTYDAVLVPGGGVREGGALPSWIERRLDRAIERYGAGYIVALSAGTTHRPPRLDAHGFPIFESAAAARYLIAAGVPADRILTETASYDTIGNAFFSRVIHADPQRWRRLLIVTSDFHLPRTQAVFEWMYSLPPAPQPYDLDFESVPASGMPPDLWADRQRKEQRSLQEFEPIRNRIANLRDCHQWLFTIHNAYNAGAPGFAHPGVDAATLKSY